VATVAGRLVRGVGASLGALLLTFALAACSNEFDSQAQDAFDRLDANVPWSISGGTSNYCQCGGGGPRICGPHALRVLATDDVVLSGLPDVLRRIGFSKNVRKEGCRDCAQHLNVVGADADGRELAIYVDPLDGGMSLLHAYLQEPGFFGKP